MSQSLAQHYETICTGINNDDCLLMYHLKYGERAHKSANIPCATFTDELITVLSGNRLTITAS